MEISSAKIRREANPCNNSMNYKSSRIHTMAGFYGGTPDYKAVHGEKTALRCSDKKYVQFSMYAHGIPEIRCIH